MFLIPAVIFISIKNRSPSSFSLGQFKWIFNKTSGMPDIATLKTNVLSALKKADGSPVDQLESLLNNTEVLSKIRSFFGDQSILDGADILKHLEKDDIFMKIFEIAE
jgi:hypothetical protein